MSENGAKAPQACIACRKQKRKCDKVLPECGLCRRIGRTCDYSPESVPTAPGPDDFNFLRQKILELEARLADGSSSSNGSSGGHQDATANTRMDIDKNTHGLVDSNSMISPHSLSTYSNSLLPPTSLASVNIWQMPSAFHSLFFLDSALFEHGRFTVQKPRVSVPREILGVLGEPQELRGTIELYFATIHMWLPIVSKIRLYQFFANPLLEPGADMALLFLAMKLITQNLPDTPQGPQTPLYLMAKTFFASVEAQAVFSIHLIQAALLIAAYELGHSVYPAAYLSIGYCARLGVAMGLHDRKDVPLLLPRCNTWTEQEERRRVWWAVIVLDRYVNIGNRGHPFASADPDLDVQLPVDDTSWDKGEMVLNAPLSLSVSTTIRVAPFARTCQASHLLGRVVRHMNDRKMDLDFRFEEAILLHRTVQALACLLPDEAENMDTSGSGHALCTSMALCYSGLLSLYDLYSCTERAPEGAPATQPVMQEAAISGLRGISGEVMTLTRRIRSFIEISGVQKTSPLVTDCLYQTAANYAWYVRESGDEECAQNLTEVKDLLKTLNRRWKVAGEYVRIVEASEFLAC